MADEASRDIVIYRGAPVARIALNQLIQRLTPDARTVNLMSDIFTSDYGVTGFLLLDSQPEGGRGYYPNGEFGWYCNEEEWKSSCEAGIYENDLRVKCKNVPFPGTFKMVRYFIMPEKVGDLFRGDKFLGEPMINKICIEDLVPEEFDEHRFTNILAEEKAQEYAELLEQICGENILNLGIYFGHKDHRAYQSFHLFSPLFPIRDIAQEAVVKALARFDQFIARFDTAEKLKDSRQNLTIENGTQYPTLLLPEDQ